MIKYLKTYLISIIRKDKVKLNHNSREVDLEELLQLASGGVDDAHTPLIEGEALGEQLSQSLYCLSILGTNHLWIGGIGNKLN